MIRGKPLPLPKDPAPPTETELDALSAKWDANCPPYYKGLLDAQPIRGGDTSSRWMYDPARMVYIHRKSGRIATRKEIASAFIYYQTKTSRK